MKILDLFKRTPNEIIHQNNEIYLRRWFIIPKNRFFKIYLHNFCSSDEDRALHDHPWCSLGIILKGRYKEHFPLNQDFPKDQRTKTKIKSAGNITYRNSKMSHRIELIDNKPVWTLFFAGPKIKEWGFWHKTGWAHWKNMPPQNKK